PNHQSDEHVSQENHCRHSTTYSVRTEPLSAFTTKTAGVDRGGLGHREKAFNMACKPSGLGEARLIFDDAWMTSPRRE
ncbi:hypothetical protein N9M41_07270, partial [Rhodopirellula sp.]|nr:hypothetical protein [Rhodopirellula sp.]